jgi:hypothetical protein
MLPLNTQLSSLNCGIKVHQKQQVNDEHQGRHEHENRNPHEKKKVPTSRTSSATVRTEFQI